MTDTLDTLIDRAARGVLLRSEGPALRAAVAELRAERDRFAAGVPLICADERHEAKVRGLEARIAELSAGCGQLHRAVHANRERAEKAESQVAAVRALHHDEYGLCAECTGSRGVPWPCSTITALDGPPALVPVKAMQLVPVSQEDVEDWALCAPTGQPERLMVKKVTSWTAGCRACRLPVAACACPDGPS